MWELRNPELVAKVLDLSSSGQKPCRVTGLVSGDILIANAVELVEWAEPTFQVLVCEACAIPGCNTGGWISLRNAGDVVLLIPAFARMEHPDSDWVEFVPPSWMNDMGAAYLRKDSYNELRLLIPGLPESPSLPTLRAREAAHLFRLDAPYRVLGSPPYEPRTNWDIVIGSSDGEPRSSIRSVLSLIETYSDLDCSIVLRPLRVDEPVLGIFLLAADYVEWNACVGVGATQRLVLGSQFVLDYDPPSN